MDFQATTLETAEHRQKPWHVTGVVYPEEGTQVGIRVEETGDTTEDQEARAETGIAAVATGITVAVTGITATGTGVAAVSGSAVETAETDQAADIDTAETKGNSDPAAGIITGKTRAVDQKNGEVRAHTVGARHRTRLILGPNQETERTRRPTIRKLSLFCIILECKL